MKKRIVLIVLLIIVTTISFLAYKHFKIQDDNILKFSGELQMDEVDVSFRTMGQLASVLVDEGVRVEKGALLATLDNTDYKLKLDLANADNTTATWALQELETGYTKEEIAQAKQQLAQARAEANNIKKEYERAKKLYAGNSISQSTYDNAETAYNVSKHKVKELSERLKQLELGIRQERIEQAKAQTLATSANVQLASQQLAYTKLASPINGVVINKYRDTGEFVQAGSTIFSIANPDELWLRAYLPVTQATMVKLGDKMAVTVDALPNEKFEGVVTYISDVAEFTPKQIQTSIERVKLVYRVKIDIVDTKGLLKSGIPADAVIWE